MIGNRVTYRGARWIVTAGPVHFQGRRWWTLRRRVSEKGRTGFRGVLAQEHGLSDVEAPVFETGESVTVGANRVPATVTGQDGRRVTLHYPAEVRTTASGLRWLRDATEGEAGIETINV